MKDKDLLHNKNEMSFYNLTILFYALDSLKTFLLSIVLMSVSRASETRIYSTKMPMIKIAAKSNVEANGFLKRICI
jgi:hypothetical protein